MAGRTIRDLDGKLERILEAVRSLSFGAFCYATRSQIAIKAGYSPQTVSVKQYLEMLEEDRLKRYYDEKKNSYFYILLEHPDAAILIERIRAGDPDVPKASEYNIRDIREQSISWRFYGAYGNLIKDLSTCNDVEDAIAFVSYCFEELYYDQQLSSSAFSHIEEFDIYEKFANTTHIVSAYLAEHTNECVYLKSLVEAGFLQADKLEAAANWSFGKFLNNLNRWSLNDWSRAISSGDYSILAMSLRGVTEPE
jgi:hypothetical protein